MSGVQTVNVAEASMVDEVLGNRSGSTVKIKTANLVAQISAALEPSFAAQDQSYVSIGALLSDTKAYDVGAVVATKAGAVYEIAPPSATDHDRTRADGTKLYARGALTPEIFASIEAAIAGCAKTGRALRGTPGATYTFTQGVTVLNAPVDMDFTGCKLVRSAAMTDRSVLRVDGALSANSYAYASDVISMAYADYNYGNGVTSVPQMTLASALGYSVGDVVKVMSSDRIPGISPWEDMRYAEMGQIGAIVGNVIYLIAPFAEAWTATKIARVSSGAVKIRGGEWFDAAGYPVARRSPLVELRGLIRPRIESMHVRDTASTQISLESCYEPTSINQRYDRPRHSVAYSAYSYGEKHIATTRPVQIGATGSRCRHIFDTGGNIIQDADLMLTSPWRFGGVINAHVSRGIGMDSLNAPFNDHPDAFGTVIENCRSIYTNRAASAATLFGLQIRGRSAKVIGGVYEGINPLHIEPSTNQKTLISGTVFIKRPATDTDVARQAGLEVYGLGVFGGGKARVVFEGVRVEGIKGRKELFQLQRAEVEFSGSVDYAMSLSNGVVFRLESASKLNINRLDADFGDSTAPTPMIVSLADAASTVFAPGLVSLRGAKIGGSAIVLCDYNNMAGAASFDDVVADGTLFNNESGWRNGNNATLQRAVVRRSDTGGRSFDVVSNFSAGGGPKPILWPVGMGDPFIHATINPTTTNTSLGSVPNGVFVGQRLALSNVGQFAFSVASISNVTVTATRTVEVGTLFIMRWSGTAWTA